MVRLKPDTTTRSRSDPAARRRRARCRFSGGGSPARSRAARRAGCRRRGRSCTATYCLPPAVNVTGKPCTEVPSRVSHSVSPVLTSNARNMRSRSPTNATPAGRGQHAGQERRALLAAPHCLHRPDVDTRRACRRCRRVPGISKKRRSAPVPPEPFVDLDFARRTSPCRLWLSGMISDAASPGGSSSPASCGRPRCSGTHRTHWPTLLLEDVGAVGRRAGLRIDATRRRSETPFPCSRGTRRSARSSFHRMPGLPIVNTQLLVADVDQHALEHFVEIERFARRVLVVPRERAVRRTAAPRCELV